MTCANATVAIGYIHSGTVLEPFCDSLLKCYIRDVAMGHQHIRGIARVQTAIIATGRNLVAGEFVNAGTAEWLLFVDTDMGFPPDVICQLVEAAHPEERPIVAALAFVPQNGRLAANWQRWNVDRTLLEPFREIPSETLVELDACGMACTLIHRSVFEKLLAEYGGTDPVWPFFGHDTLPGGARLGEDLTFCLRARRVGCSIWGHRGPFLDHYKLNRINADSFERQRQRQGHVAALLADQSEQ